jgi:hypothetical protein
MTTNASRVPVDYDGYEQDRQPAHTHQGHPGARPDPLAELARIVGQDDPFRALLEAKEAKEATRAAEPPRGRVEPVMPSYGEAPSPEAGLSATRNEPTLGAPMPAHTPASAFNQYLAAVERETDAEPAPVAPEPEPEPALEPRPRGRRRIALVGTALGIVAASIGGALTWKAFHHSRSGAPILVVADQTPLKVAPQNAGGVEIPDQNKQIYERTATAPAKDGQIRIVNREEQPLDVKQAARSLAAEAGASATPAIPGNALTESLGEPRRVRTVSVRPEPSPAEAQRAAQAAAQAQAAQAPATSPMPTMTLPSEATGSTPAPVTPRGPRTISTAPAARTPIAETPAAETPAPVAESRQKPVQRVASAEAPTTTQAVPTPQAPVGGFSVQLSVRATEKEAEVAFRQAQERYGAVLGGQSPLIRQAEVNGKSIYRVRVGPMAKDSADGLCGKLKAAGAACFVAKN